MTGAPIARTADDTRSPGRLVARTCAAEWTRLWTVRSSWWLLLATTVVLVGLGTLLGFESAADPAALKGEPAWQTAMNIVLLAQFALLAFALTAVTSDYATGGIVPTLQWTPSRTVLFLARTLVAVGVATGAGVGLALGAALAAHATAGSALVLPWADGPDMVARVAGVIAGGTALAAGLGFLLRSTAGALVSVFLLVLVLPALLPQFGYDWLTAVADALPGAGAVFLLIGEPDSRGVSDGSAAATMLGWAAGALLLGWLRLLRDDVSR
jgi:ABC-2 type transport system permease protein